MNTHTISKPGIAHLRAGKPDLTADEKKRLKAALKELDRLESTLVRGSEIRALADSIADRYAAGEVELHEALCVLTVAGDSHSRAEAVSALRKPIKARMRTIAGTVSDIAEKAFSQRVEWIEAKLAEVEEREREEAVSLGIDPAEVEPGLTARRLKTNLRNAGHALDHIRTRQTPSVADLREIARQIEAKQDADEDH